MEKRFFLLWWKKTKFKTDKCQIYQTNNWLIMKSWVQPKGRISNIAFGLACRARAQKFSSKKLADFNWWNLTDLNTSLPSLSTSQKSRVNLGFSFWRELWYLNWMLFKR